MLSLVTSALALNAGPATVRGQHRLAANIQTFDEYLATHSDLAAAPVTAGRGGAGMYCSSAVYKNRRRAIFTNAVSYFFLFLRTRPKRRLMISQTSQDY